MNTYSDDAILACIPPDGCSSGYVCRALTGSKRHSSIGKRIGQLVERGALVRGADGLLRMGDETQEVPRECVRDVTEERASFAKGQGGEKATEPPVEQVPERTRCHSATMSGRVLVCPDVHAPYHDRRAWATFIAAARILKPDAVVVIGDFLDCYSVSSHSKDPKRRANLAAEVDQAAELLSELTDATAGARHWILEGNHEYRLPRYVADRAPELDGFLQPLPERLGCKRHGWTWIDSQSYLKLGRMSFAHGWRCGKYALPQTVAEWGGCITFGHTHRLGVWYAGDVRGDDHVGLNVGWLGDIESIDYRYRATAERDWQLGFGVIELDEDGIAFAHAVPIINGRTRVGVRRVSGAP